MDEVEEFVNGGGSREVSDVNGTAGSSVCDTENNLEGTRRILHLLRSESDDKAEIGR